MILQLNSNLDKPPDPNEFPMLEAEQEQELVSEAPQDLEPLVGLSKLDNGVVISTIQNAGVVQNCGINQQNSIPLSPEQEAATTSIVDMVMDAEDDDYSSGDEDEFNENGDLNGAGKSNLSSSLNMGDRIAGQKEKMDSVAGQNGNLHPNCEASNQQGTNSHFRKVAGWCYCAGQIWVDFIWAGNLEAALYRWTSGFKGWGNFSGQGCEGITDGKDKCLKNVDFQNGQPITIKGYEGQSGCYCRVKGGRFLHIYVGNSLLHYWVIYQIWVDLELMSGWPFSGRACFLKSFDYLAYRDLMGATLLIMVFSDMMLQYLEPGLHLSVSNLDRVTCCFKCRHYGYMCWPKAWSKFQFCLDHSCMGCMILIIELYENLNSWVSLPNWAFSMFVDFCQVKGGYIIMPYWQGHLGLGRHSGVNLLFVGTYFGISFNQDMPDKIVVYEFGDSYGLMMLVDVSALCPPRYKVLPERLVQHSIRIKWAVTEAGRLGRGAGRPATWSRWWPAAFQGWPAVGRGVLRGLVGRPWGCVGLLQRAGRGVLDWVPFSPDWAF
ncbi:hypothetical protein E3N88_43214 [Mikania micrantha]|uniref:Uncharacterized protein n=1 Tax=Mikania micrantha TaxID=192012 RepID=A0A5N6LFK8_9ASTR|nr:hypothetical protein E3N88_43214 [Mikania micrantha]